MDPIPLQANSLRVRRACGWHMSCYKTMYEAIQATQNAKATPGSYLVDAIQVGVEVARGEHRSMRIRVQWVPVHEDVDVSDEEAKAAAHRRSTARADDVVRRRTTRERDGGARRGVREYPRVTRGSEFCGKAEREGHERGKEIEDESESDTSTTSNGQPRHYVQHAGSKTRLYFTLYSNALAYEEPRRRLGQAVRRAKMTIDHLLAKKNAFPKLIKFIHETNRFEDASGMYATPDELTDKIGRTRPQSRRRKKTRTTHARDTRGQGLGRRRRTGIIAEAEAFGRRQTREAQKTRE
ncbi:hypothetical protein FA95DRAFT_1577465 [Auriscalpium vulgare]|uniref:Uncharacterized protein n=1 Tax=Auriscalpium vulgare TaxID=40419 RepID=A0ACB8R6X2_9AGAM|nr:hypothetical protein FA95DRAFT_1577465 [Auriscalpium vulgare]